MRYEALGQNSGAATIEEPLRSGSGTGGVGVKEIPYDYVATFRLTGERGKRVQDVITISTEGTFVAVSVGYSFLPVKPLVPVPPIAPPELLRAVFEAAFGPVAAPDVFKAFAHAAVLRAAGIHFLYTIVDSGSGRELQNKAVHSVAGLGAADGDRPFRPFARPVPFVPRATIRIEIEEVSEGALFRDGTLFIVLHGYKRLGE